MFLRGLVEGLPQADCCTNSEHPGERSPTGIQRFPAAALWDGEGLRADLRDYVVVHIGPDAVLVIDETGGPKKGRMTVGVQRQYSGMAGGIKDSQVVVSLIYASRRQHTFLDNALYLPKSWTSDPDRR